MAGVVGGRRGAGHVDRVHDPGQEARSGAGLSGKDSSRFATAGGSGAKNGSGVVGELFGELEAASRVAKWRPAHAGRDRPGGGTKRAGRAEDQGETDIGR